MFHDLFSLELQGGNDVQETIQLLLRTGGIGHRRSAGPEGRILKVHDDREVKAKPAVEGGELAEEITVSMRTNWSTICVPGGKGRWMVKLSGYASSPASGG